MSEEHNIFDELFESDVQDIGNTLLGDEVLEDASLLEDTSEDIFKDIFKDIFGDEFGDELGNELDGDFAEGFDDLFGEEGLRYEELDLNRSNMSDWLEPKGNPQLINIDYKNPNDRIYFRDLNFDYSGDYSDLKFIFERFRSDLLEGEI